MKIIIITFFMFFCVALSYGQAKVGTEVIERNTIYAEVFGQGLCYSINYDRLFNIEKRFKNSFTVGMVYVPKLMQFGEGTYFGVPVSYNWLLGKKSHHLELGLGITGLYAQPSHSATTTNFYTYLTPKIGYRYQRPTGGLFFKATATPMIDLLSVNTNKIDGPNQRIFSTLGNVAGLDYGVFPWPGASIGYTFK